jgi:hypothetical protein
VAVHRLPEGIKIIEGRIIAVAYTVYIDSDGEAVAVCQATQGY